jgi:hypothetical protein
VLQSDFIILAMIFAFAYVYIYMFSILLWVYIITRMRYKEYNAYSYEEMKATAKIQKVISNRDVSRFSNRVKGKSCLCA